MPVRRADPDSTGVDPYRRLSASQVITWNTCPRLWYYSYIPKLKSPLPPQILRGNAVEECISRILRESPVYISSSDIDKIASPLNSDGSVAYDSDEGWMGPKLEVIPKENWPFLGNISEWPRKKLWKNLESVPKHSHYIHTVLQNRQIT